MPLNEEASAGAIGTFVIAVALCGLVIVFFGPVIDKTLLAGGLGGMGEFVSQDRIDAVNLLLLAWRALPFILLFGWGIWLLKTQLDKSPGVD